MKCQVDAIQYFSVASKSRRDSVGGGGGSTRNFPLMGPFYIFRHMCTPIVVKSVYGGGERLPVWNSVLGCNTPIIKVVVLLVRQLWHGFTKNAKVSPNLTVRSPVLCFSYLYSLLIRVFSYNITPHQFELLRANVHLISQCSVFDSCLFSS